MVWQAAAAASDARPLAIGPAATRLAGRTARRILPAMLQDLPDVEGRLDAALVIWLTTVTPAGQPQSSPVWFIREGDDLVVRSLANAPRLRNIRGNPRVALNLDGDGRGGAIVTLEGAASIADASPRTLASSYVTKYRPLIESYGWTVEGFARDYPVPIRIVLARVRVG